MAISPSHRFAVYQYTDRVTDPYYIGKRFISANTIDAKSDSDRMVIVATADTVEECQLHLDNSPRAMAEWLAHQDKLTGGALSRMLAESDHE